MCICVLVCIGVLVCVGVCVCVCESETILQCRVLLEKAVETDLTFQPAVIQLSKLYLREGAGPNAVDL